MKNLYEKLLKEYCDALISLQDKGEDPAFKGGIYCRACKMIHGRCPDSVYGFTVMAKLSGDEKYLNAAKAVFDYGDNMLCGDGALYNDAQANWRYTTTFHAIAVIEALHAGKAILDKDTVEKFEDRARGMTEWLYHNLNEFSYTNINYTATNGLALALCGKYFGNEKYLKQAVRLVKYAMRHISKNGLLYGETKPHNAQSPKGCYAVDIGYNVEETIPALIKYAFEVNDDKLKDDLERVLLSHFDFMLPDGAWDNSFGVRNNKWTYWGSRTSDGCAPAFLLMADRNPAFAEAALRNTELLEKCSIGGFLYGGPHYHSHGEPACTHHTFEHINSVAFAVENIDEKYLSPKRTDIPSDNVGFYKFYPEVRTYKLSKGDYLATVTDYDFDISFSGHASGGTLTALYHKKTGPMIMGSVTDYVLVEPTNMQQTLDREHHRSLVPRLSFERAGETYLSSFHAKAETAFTETEDSYTVTATSGLTSNKGIDCDDIHPEITYTLSSLGMEILIKRLYGSKFILPLISGRIEVVKGEIESTDGIFFLTGGFCATEYILSADQNDELVIRIV